jgi:hypothetical protein
MFLLFTLIAGELKSLFFSIYFSINIKTLFKRELSLDVLLLGFDRI